jgi:tRNA (guanine-N7-)-methyltransferase
MFQPVSLVEPLNFSNLFPEAKPIELELGSGDGSFLVTYAQSRPHLNLLGVERLLGRIRKIDRKAFRANLHNIRLLRLEASYTLEYLIPAEGVQAIHVYFPDPWPKRRHHRRRLINESFVKASWRALSPGGAVYLRTDDKEYFAQMTSVYGAFAGFETIETPPELCALITDFEGEFLKQGISTQRAAYRKI